MQTFFIVIGIFIAILIIRSLIIKNSTKHKQDVEERFYQEELYCFLKNQTFAYTTVLDVPNGKLSNRSDKKWGENSIKIVISYFKEKNYTSKQTLEFLKSDFGKCIIYEFKKIKTNIYDSSESVKPVHFAQAIVHANDNFNTYKNEEIAFELKSKNIVNEYMPINFKA